MSEVRYGIGEGDGTQKLPREEEFILRKLSCSSKSGNLEDGEAYSYSHKETNNRSSVRNVSKIYQRLPVSAVLIEYHRVSGRDSQRLLASQNLDPT